MPCSKCDAPACALVASRWYCLHHLRDLAQDALEQRDQLADCLYKVDKWASQLNGNEFPVQMIHEEVRRGLDEG